LPFVRQVAQHPHGKPDRRPAQAASEWDVDEAGLLATVRRDGGRWMLSVLEPKLLSHPDRAELELVRPEVQDLPSNTISLWQM